MNIARTAPEKYEFQDLVCVELALRFENHTGAQLRIEPSEGEDGELTLPQPTGLPLTIEVQVKGAQGVVALADLAEFLVHFPPREASGCLFERLLANPACLALFVVTGRCDDAASRYVVPTNWAGAPHAGGFLSAAAAATLLTSIECTNLTGKGELKEKREAHYKQLAREADLDRVRKALERLVVLERVSSIEVEAACERHFRRHRIPTDGARDALARMMSAIKRAKRESSDALGLIRTELGEIAPTSLKPPGYVVRGAEASWEESLTANNALLLSGPPRCGKTNAAHWIAGIFQERGYDVREDGDVAAARRFLLEPGPGDRLVVLDDPLGGLQPASDATRVLRELRTLIGRVAPSRKLIVAQMQDVLLSIARQRSLADCSIEGRRWADLNDLAPDFLARLWQSMTASPPLQVDLREGVSTALAKGIVSLEPGCLRHLAANHDRLKGDFSLEAAVRLARQDAADFGRSLSGERAETELVLVALAIGSAPSEPLHSRELAFMLGTGEVALPGKWLHLGLSLGGSPPKPSTIPQYDTTPVLDEAFDRSLEDLERRRVVEILPNGRIALTHAFYRAAAEAVLNGPTTRLAERAVLFLERGLLCVAPWTARASARNLGWLFDALAGRRDIQCALVDKAIAGLDSIFPAARDLCFNFLVSRIADFPTERAKGIGSWAARVNSVNLEDIEWHDGEATLRSGTDDFLDRLARRYDEVKREDVCGVLSALEDEAPGIVSPQDAARALRFLEGSPGAMSSAVLSRFLSFDEAVIRSAAVHIWMSEARSNDGDVIKRIFDDDHPQVISAALVTVVEGWPRYDDARRRLLLDGLASAADSPAVAVTFLQQLVVFDREEEFGESPPWPVFARLLPIVMAALPRGAHFIEARLFSVAQSAVKELDPPAIERICGSWVSWLEQETTDGRLPSDHALGVVDILLAATRTTPDLRSSLFNRLLQFPGTGALLVFIADLVDEWTTLVAPEREAIISVLTRERADRRWLQAAALTRAVAPPGVQQALLGAPERLDGETGDLINTLPPALLQACIAVYCGRPQPLWALGKHHSSSPVWIAILEAIAEQPNHPQFEVALENWVLGGHGDRIARVARAGTPQQVKRLFELLLRHKVIGTAQWLSDAWEALLTSAPDAATRNGWLDRMAEAAPAILDDLSETRLWVPNHQRALVDRLATDHTLALLVDMLRALPLEEAPSTVVETSLSRLAHLFCSEPPKLTGTCNRARTLLSSSKVNAPELLATIEKRHNAILDEARDRKAAAEFEESIPPDWIAP